MRVAIYARVSTDEQAQSCDVQELDARRFAVARGWGVVEVYRDEGVSGADFVTRPAFLRMMRDLCAEGPRPWDVLVMRDLDRLGRDQAHTVIAVEKIISAGAKLWTYSGGREVTLTPIEKALLGMQAVFGEFERAMIVGRVRGSHEHRARAGFVTGGSVYGYRNARRPDGFVEHVVDDDQANVVREVFRRRAEGATIRALALDLNRRRVPPPSGGRRGTGSWSPGALHAMLHSERYCGVLQWGATRKGYLDGRKVREAQASADLVRVERPELRIVDAETWARVRALDAGVRGRTGTKPAHLLTGYVVCAVCNGPLAVCGTRRGTTSIHAYGCAWARDRGPTVCNVTLRRPADELEGEVLAWMEREALAESTVAEVLSEARAILEARTARPDETRATLEHELATVTRERDRLARALAVAGDVEALAIELRARDDRARTLHAQLASLPADRQTLGDWAAVERETREILDTLRTALGRGLEGARRVLGVLLRGTKLRAREVLTGGSRRRYTLEGVVYLPPGGLLASPEGIGQSPRVAMPVEIPCGQRTAA